MLIDWFTVGAQIVNFLILVALLKYFLYDRIIQVMEAREQTIASRLEEAQSEKQEAETLIREYREKRRELEHNRDQLLAAAKIEVDSKRRELLEKARDAVDETEKEWREQLERERKAFLDELRRRLGKESISIARTALQELVDEDLEERIAHRFLQELRGLNHDTIEALRKATTDAEQPVTVVSAFDIRPEGRSEIANAIAEEIGDNVRVSFDRSSELVSGIAMTMAGHRIAWSIDDYLVSMEEEFSRVLESEANGLPATLSNDMPQALPDEENLRPLVSSRGEPTAQTDSRLAPQARPFSEASNRKGERTGNDGTNGSRNRS